MFIVAYFVIIVHYVCFFEEKSKMSFPKRRGVRPCSFLLKSLAGMCITLVGNRVVDLFSRQNKLAVCISRRACCIYLSISSSVMFIAPLPWHGHVYVY